MFRRRFLRTAGAVGASTIAATGLTSARQEGEKPNERVESTTVGPFAARDDPEQVPAGNWITHKVGWIDIEGGDSTREDIVNYLDAVDLSVWIDGERVENADQYWGEPETTADGEWIVWWEYETPPKAPGLHEFKTVWSYPDGYTDGKMTIPDETRGVLTGYYEVVKEARRER